MAKSKKPNETLMTFPCQFPLKVMGTQGVVLEDFIKTVLHNHVKDSHNITYNTRDSSDGNYISITAMFTAESKAQLDKIYQAINHNKHVKMVL